ncbi:MAG TPA: hypothetical protein DCY94_02970 [Firmicutes bacterium]|nr:hypothetical protein [Bacillota bacterium]
MSLKLNIDLNFKDVNLGKLTKDASEAPKTDLSSSISDVTKNYQTEKANAYGGLSNNKTETIDLTNDISKPESVSLSSNASTPTADPYSEENIKKSTSSLNFSKDTSQEQTVGQNNAVSDAVKTSMSTDNKTAYDENSQLNDVKDQDRANKTILNKDSSNMNSKTFNNAEGGQTAKDMTTSTKTNDLNTDQSLSSNGKSGTASMNNSSSSMMMNNSKGSSNDSDMKNIGTDFNMDIDFSKEDNFESTTSSPKVISTDSKGIMGKDIFDSKENDDMIKTLKIYGLQDADIAKIRDGKATIEEILAEIANDKDNSRRKDMMYASYLQAYGTEHNNMADLQKSIDVDLKTLAELQDQRRQSDDREMSSLMNILLAIKSNQANIEDLFTKIPVAWEYRDKNGNICYRYDDPYAANATDGISYTPKTFVSMYGEKRYDEIKKLTESTYKPLFGKEMRTSYIWNDSEEQRAYYENILKEFGGKENSRKSNLDELDKKIEELETKIATNRYIYEEIENEVNYYMANIDAYTSKKDFLTNSSFNGDIARVLDEKIDARLEDTNTMQSFGNSDSAIYFNSKSEVTELLACLINDSASTRVKYGLASSNDHLYSDYQNWIHLMTDDEKSVFNYVFNTEGAEEAYDYLEKIADELDYRYLAERTQKDQKFADEHPVLSSVASIVVTPIEGISAAAFSLNSLMTNQKIRRSEVYSAGDVWRSEVANDIATNYGNGWSFVYSTGMSMADSVSLIALSVATGGTASPVLSATLMGSRAYVSTLNEALDRGLSDKSAVLLAGAAGIVETAMENYSVGHLLNLEGKLGKTTIDLTKKIATTVKNPNVANLITKSFYVGASALSQGLAEGEEELATEILNYATDIFISKDLSNYSTSIASYLDFGYTEDEAAMKTMKDFSSQATQAFLGGFASGICFGAFGGTKNTIQTSNAIAQNMYAELDGSKTAYNFARALEINRNQTSQIEEAKKKLNTNGELSIEEITLLQHGTIEMQSAQALKKAFYDSINRAFKIENNITNKTSTLQSEKEIRDARIEKYTNKPEIEDIVAASSGKFNEHILEMIKGIDSNDALVETFVKIVQGDFTLEGTYESKDAYRRDIVRTLIESGEIDNLTNKPIYLMTQSQVMLEELVGTEKLNNLYINNLLNSNVQSNLIRPLSNLSATELDTIFNSNSMSEFINSMSSADLTSILTNFAKNGNAFWLTNKTIVERISKFEIPEFYNLVEGISLSESNLKSLLEQDHGRENYLSLLNAIETKYYKGKIVAEDMSRKDSIDHILVSIFGVDESIERKINDIKDLQKRMDNSIKKKFAETCGANIVYNAFQCGLQVDDKYTYYDIVLDADGELETFTYSQSSGQIDLWYNLLNKPKYAQLVLEGKLKISDVSVNAKKSNLVLTSEMGLGKGLNDVIMLIDGVEHNLVISSQDNTRDLNYDNNPLLKNATTVEVKSIVNKGSMNIKVEDRESLYRITYEVNGVEQTTYMTTPRTSRILNTDELVLNVDEFIADNNLTGVENVRAEKVDAHELVKSMPKISDYSAFSDIMSQDKYGGNQSDVETLMRKRIKGEQLTELEAKKADLLNSLIDKYFPSATDVDRVNLAEHFASGGCAYMATANAFMTFLGSQENGATIFKDRFGYDLAYQTEDTVSYNLEALVFDMYLSRFASKYQSDLEAMKKSEFNKEPGISGAEFGNIVGSYLKERGFGLKTSIVQTQDTSHNKDRNILASSILNNKNGFSVLMADTFDLRILNKDAIFESSQDRALANATDDGEYKRNIGGHAMLITDINEDLNLIISSWGFKYEFSIDSVENYKKMGRKSQAYVLNIEFEMPGNLSAVTHSEASASEFANEQANASLYDEGKTEELDPTTVELEPIDTLEIQRQNKEILDRIRKSKSIGNVRPLSDLEIMLKKNQYNRLMADYDVKDYYEIGKSVLNATQAEKIVLTEKLSEEISMGVGSLDAHDIELINRLKANQKSNLELKQKILDKVSGITDPFSKIRALYIELNRSLNYDMNFFKNSKIASEQLLKADAVTFDWLNEERKVICKGWAELYRELLIEAGIDESLVSIKGENHFWVEIAYGESVIIADATDSIEKQIDLTASKAGMKTVGFVLLPKSYSGARLNTLYKQHVITEENSKAFNEYLLKVDQNIGFANEKGYLAEQIQASKGLFGGKGLLAKVMGHRDAASTIEELCNRALPENMDGYEIYQYYRTILKNNLNDGEFTSLKFNGRARVIPASELGFLNKNYESVFVLQYNGKGGTPCSFIFSKTLGKHILKGQEQINEFMNKYRIL